MNLSDLLAVSTAVSGTRSRLKKREYLSDGLKRAGTDEIRLVVSYLAGVLPQGKLGVGYALLRDIAVEAPEEPASHELSDIDAAFTRIAETAGKGSKERRRAELEALFANCSIEERDFLQRLILGELRQGALEAVLVDALADATGLPPSDLRRAVMLEADPAVVAEVAFRDGAEGLAQFQLEPLKPVKPMLAQPAEGIDEALDAHGRAALELKLDGARVQVHRSGDEVRVYSRALNEVTASVPEVVEAALSLPVESIILDGEVIALDRSGRPLPFQVTMRRFGRRSNVEEMRQKLPLSVFLFDCLYVNGEALIDEPYSIRAEKLATIASADQRVESLVTDQRDEATAFLTAALERGHEGVMAKSPGSPYAAGSRGAEWLKIKQAHTLDLVVLAAEWGSGRRKGWLSNLHLGARDPETGGFVMLGKTFKGLTDRLLAWQTKALLELETNREDYVVHVKPVLVVEIAFNDLQESPQYSGGVALRFARVKRYRTDKTADEADTMDTVRRLFLGQRAPAAGESD